MTTADQHPLRRILKDRIAIIDGGELLALDTPAALTRQEATTTTEVVFTSAVELNVDHLHHLTGALGAGRAASTAAREGRGCVRPWLKPQSTHHHVLGGVP